jgi:MatE
MGNNLLTGLFKLEYFRHVFSNKGTNPDTRGQPSYILIQDMNANSEKKDIEVEDECETSSSSPVIGSERDNTEYKFDEYNRYTCTGTSWQLETRILLTTSAPLILTSILQYSLTVVSVAIVGHIGKVELAAVSLASSKQSPIPLLHRLILNVI